MTDRNIGQPAASGDGSRDCAWLANRLESVLEYLRLEFEPQLSTVLSMADLLQGSMLSGEQAEYVRTLRDSAEGMGLLLRGLGDMAWSGTQECLGGVEEFDLRVLVHDMVEITRIHARRRSVHFVPRIDDEVPGVVGGVPGALRRVVRGFLSQALGAPKGATIRLDLRPDERHGDMVTVRFSVGVDAVLPEPEENFMAVSRNLAGRFGGAAGFESGDGSSLFWATFVLPELKASRASFPPPQSIGGQRILVVDADAAWRGVVREYCYLWDCRFAEAEDGASALEQMRLDASLGGGHDIVLVGSSLINVSPEDFCRAVRADMDIAGSMLVLMAAAAKPGDAARMADAGYDGFLSRPVDHERLHDALCLVLGARRSEGSFGLVTRHVVAEERKRRKVVLLVDADRERREVLRGMLNRAGYVFVEATSGREARDALGQTSFVVALVDLGLEDMTAADVVRLLRDPASGLDSDMPVIAMAGSGAVADAAGLTRDGFAEVLQTPADSHSFFRVVEKYLQPNDSGKGRYGSLALDVERLLEQLDNDRELLADVLQTFLLEGRTRVAECMDAARGDDFATAEQKANALRGMAGNIRAEGVRVLAEMAEQACRRAHGDKAVALGEEMLREFDRVEKAVALACAPRGRRVPLAQEERAPRG